MEAVEEMNGFNNLFHYELDSFLEKSLWENVYLFTLQL